MRSVSCYLKNYEDRGLFVGCVLNTFRNNLEKHRKSENFQKMIEEKFADFSSLYEYNLESLEKYFGRSEQKLCLKF